MRASLGSLWLCLAACTVQAKGGPDVLKTLDLADLHITPWSAMHLQMLYAPSDVVYYDGTAITVASLAEKGLEGLDPVWVASGDEPRGST